MFGDGDAKYIKNECVNGERVRVFGLCGNACAQQGCSTEAQVAVDNPVELLWQAVENILLPPHTCSVAFY